MARNSQARGLHGCSGGCKSPRAPALSDLTAQSAQGGGRRQRAAQSPGAGRCRQRRGWAPWPPWPPPRGPSAGSAPTLGRRGLCGAGSPDPTRAPGHLAGEEGEVFSRAGFFISVLASSFIFKTTSRINICRRGVNWEFPWQSGDFQRAQCFLPSCARGLTHLLPSGVRGGVRCLHGVRASGCDECRGPGTAPEPGSSSSRIRASIFSL